MINCFLKNRLLIVLLGVVFIPTNSFALMPMESLALGDFSSEYSESKNDPLDFVFGRDLKNDNKSLDEFKNNLAIYRGFYEEGKNLINSCKKTTEIRYNNEWDKIQVERTIMSEIQYIGLDITSRAIPQYAKYFEFSEEEYKNLVDDLVGNYCSNNLSVISKRELKNNLLLKFTKDNSFTLPTVKGNPLFPDNMDKYVSEKLAKDHEFKTTIKIFQSMCSWSGDPDSPGLMVPFLKHGALMSFINRQFDGKTIGWNKEKNTLNLVENNKSIQVLCDNLICRKTTQNEFKNKIILSVGSTSFGQDFKYLFCDSFQVKDYNTKNIDPRLKKMINDLTFDDENFLVGQFIALITGYPDFLLGLEKFTAGEDLLRASIDYTWTNWAKTQSSNLNRELYFEEPLTLELIDRKLYFKNDQKDLKVAFDVNLGEIDRINQKVGKLGMNFKIEIPASYIKYHRSALIHLDWSIEGEKDRLINRFKYQLEKLIRKL